MTLLATFKRRSSWPSSIATSLIGWNAFFCIVALVLGYGASAFTLILSASIAGVIQVVVLRLAFFFLKLDKGLIYGFVWGTISGGLLIPILWMLFTFLKDNSIIWILNGAYIGFAVGGFLSYFYRDDKEIEKKSPSEAKDTDYGRDEHWLEPFIFGAIIYLLVYLFPSFDVSVFLVIIGAMVGVFAAGTSHFSPDAWKKSALFIILIFLIGACFGLGSAFLFRGYSELMRLPNYLSGAISGALTFLVTFIRGKYLARTKHHHFE